MFDVLNAVNKRYFEIKLSTEEKSIIVNVEPPKLKALKHLQEISSKDEVNIDEVTSAVSKVLNKNKENRDVSEYVENMDIDELQAVLIAYFEWINGEKNSKN